MKNARPRRMAEVQAWGLGQWKLVKHKGKQSAVQRLEAELAAARQAERVAQPQARHAPVTRAPTLAVGTTVAGTWAGRSYVSKVRAGDWTCNNCGACTCRQSTSACYVCNAIRPTAKGKPQGQAKKKKKAQGGAQTDGGGGTGAGGEVDANGKGRTNAATKAATSTPSSTPPPPPADADAPTLSPESTYAQKLLSGMRAPRAENEALVRHRAAKAAEEATATDSSTTTAASAAEAVTMTGLAMDEAEGMTAANAETAQALRTVIKAAAATADPSGSGGTAPQVAQQAKLMVKVLSELAPMMGSHWRSAVTSFKVALEEGELAAAESKAGAKDDRTGGKDKLQVPLKSPSQWVAVRKKEVAGAEAALADFRERATRCTAEDKAKRLKAEEELQAKIKAAQAAYDLYVAGVNEVEEKWRLVHADQDKKLVAAVAAAEQKLQEAVATEAEAGTLAHVKPKPGEVEEDGDLEADDDADDAADDDDDRGDDVLMTGDARGDEGGETPPSVQPYIEPPALDGPIDEATAAKIQMASGLLLHAMQQKTFFPVTYAALGMTPVDAKRLIGDAAWATAYAEDATVTPDHVLPPGLPGVLLTAIWALPRDAAQCDKQREEARQRSQDLLVKAAEAAPARATLRAKPKSLLKVAGKAVKNKA